MENIEEVEKKSILELSKWWGLSPTPGHSSIIITEDKKIYHYHFYHRLDKFLSDNNIPKESLSRPIDLTDSQYKRIIQFIENEILGKSFKDNMIFDAGYNLKVNYNGKNYNIINNVDFKDKSGIFDRAEILIKEIEGEIKDGK